MYRERLIIRRAIPVMLASLKHEEQRAQHLVANRNNRSFVATPDHKGLDDLVASATKGLNAMPPKGGYSGSDAEFRAAVEYIVNGSK